MFLCVLLTVFLQREKSSGTQGMYTRDLVILALVYVWSPVFSCTVFVNEQEEAQKETEEEVRKNEHWFL